MCEEVQKVAKSFQAANFILNDVFRYSGRDVWLRQAMRTSYVICAFGT